MLYETYIIQELATFGQDSHVPPGWKNLRKQLENQIPNTLGEERDFYEKSSQYKVE